MPEGVMVVGLGIGLVVLCVGAGDTYEGPGFDVGVSSLSAATTTSTDAVMLPLLTVIRVDPADDVPGGAVFRSQRAEITEPESNDSGRSSACGAGRVATSPSRILRAQGPTGFGAADPQS
jgi:hypothetical protein